MCLLITIITYSACQKRVKTKTKKRKRKMEWTKQNVRRRNFGGTSEYVAGPGLAFLKNHYQVGAVADIGVWDGRNLPLLVKLVEERGVVYGYDHPEAEPAVLEASIRFPGVSFKMGEIIALPFNNGELSAVLCWRVLHNLTAPGQLDVALRELYRVLKIDAPLLIAVRAFNQERPWSRPMLLETKNPLGVCRTDLCFTGSACEVVLSNAGFKVKNIQLLCEEGTSDGLPYENKYWAINCVRGGRCYVG